MKFSVYAVVHKRKLFGCAAAVLAVVSAFFFVMWAVCGAFDSKSVMADAGEKTVYLTFDDGPSAVTETVLDVLKQKEVKATFFVVGQNVKANPQILQRIAKEGHAIGLHSDTHEYAHIYQNSQNFFADIDTLAKRITDLTGQTCELYRFPGGSSNSLYKKYSNGAFDMDNIRQQLKSRNLTYVDWNVSPEDAVGYQKSAAQITTAVLRQTAKQNPAVVLMHDTLSQRTTAAALADIIDSLKNQGYRFLPLDSSVSCRHGIDAYH